MSKKAVLYTENTEGILELAQYLNKNDWTIYSNGKTAELLKNNDIPVKTEPAFDNGPRNMSQSSELMNKVLATRLDPESDSPFETNDFENNVFLICVNIFPQEFTFETIPEKGSENGLNTYLTSLIRNSTINYRNVLILTDPEDYKEAIIQLRTDSVQNSFRLYLSGKALNMVSAFDSANANAILNFSPFSKTSYHKYLTLPFAKMYELHYGANPHQTAALYKLTDSDIGLGGFRKLQGRELTHKIIVDTTFAWNRVSAVYEYLKTQSSVKSTNCDGYPYVTQFSPLTGTVFTVLVKYNLIVGAGLDTNVLDSFRKSLSNDPDSINHSCLACSAVIDAEAASEIVKYDFSGIVAPGFTEEARNIFADKSSIRLVLATRSAYHITQAVNLDGGVIVQSEDSKLFEKWIVPTKTRPTQHLADEMAFGMILSMSAHSYTSLIVKDNSVAAISSGFSSRIKSLQNSLYEAKQTAKMHNEEDGKIGDILVCDSVIDLCEPVKEMIDRGISAIIQTGGNPNDQEFIDYCDEHNVTMVFTGMTHHNY